MLSGANTNAAAEHAVALNNSDVSAEYVVKLRVELEGYLSGALSGPGERERVRK